MEPIEPRYTTETKLKRIGWLSSKDPKKVFHQLMHHFNEESLTTCFHIKEIWKQFNMKLRGHFQYYGVSFNTESLNSFHDESEKIIFKWLNRRSQKRSFDWDKFKLFENRFPLIEVKIYHRFF